MLMTIEELNVLKESLKTTQSRYASLDYTNQKGDHGVYLIQLNVNYGRLLKANLSLAKRFRASSDMEKQAKAAVVESLQNSINGSNPDYTLKNVFFHLSPSIKYHLETGQLYIDGITRGYREITRGVHKHVNHNALTVAKDAIRNQFPKYRTFILDGEVLHKAKMNGKTIVL
jgi:hypothetical protein